MINYQLKVCWYEVFFYKPSWQLFKQILIIKKIKLFFFASVVDNHFNYFFLKCRITTLISLLSAYVPFCLC